MHVEVSRGVVIALVLLVLEAGMDAVVRMAVVERPVQDSEVTACDP